MIVGEVTADKEAVVHFEIRGPVGATVDIPAILDTGFTEYLTLTPDLIKALALPYQHSMLLMLADGSEIGLHVYDAIVLWDGQPRAVPAHAIEGAPLIGMSLLHGFRICADVVDGGVEIRTIRRARRG